MNWNEARIGGNLTRDPELRYTPKGTAIVVCAVAVNRKWKNRETGEENEEVTFIDFEAWGRTAEVLAQYCHKGDPIFLAGRLKLDQWDDKQTGQKRSKLKVIVESFQFLNRRGDSGQGGGEERQPQRAASTRQPVTQDDEPPLPEDDSDVPF